MWCEFDADCPVPGTLCYAGIDWAARVIEPTNATPALLRVGGVSGCACVTYMGWAPSNSTEQTDFTQIEGEFTDCASLRFSLERGVFPLFYALALCFEGSLLLRCSNYLLYCFLRSDRRASSRLYFCCLAWLMQLSGLAVTFELMREMFSPDRFAQQVAVNGQDIKQSSHRDVMTTWWVLQSWSLLSGASKAVSMWTLTAFDAADPSGNNRLSKLWHNRLLLFALSMSPVVHILVIITSLQLFGKSVGYYNVCILPFVTIFFFFVVYAGVIVVRALDGVMIKLYEARILTLGAAETLSLNTSTIMLVAGVGSFGFIVYIATSVTIFVFYMDYETLGKERSVPGEVSEFLWLQMWSKLSMILQSTAGYLLAKSLFDTLKQRHQQTHNQLLISPSGISSVASGISSVVPDASVASESGTRSSQKSRSTPRRKKSITIGKLTKKVREKKAEASKSKSKSRSTSGEDTAKSPGVTPGEECRKAQAQAQDEGGPVQGGPIHAGVMTKFSSASN